MTRLTAFSCARAGRAAAVTAAAATAPRPRNLRRFVALNGMLLHREKSAASASIVMPFSGPLRFTVLTQIDRARHLSGFGLATKLIRNARAFSAVAALEANGISCSGAAQIARRELAFM